MAAQITALPTPPNRNNPATFSVDSDTFLGALPVFVSQANTLATEAEADATTASSSAGTAAAAAITATAASDAAQSASAAALWVSGTTYAIGNVVWSPTSFLSYRRKTDGAGTTDPASDGTNWQPLSVIGLQTCWIPAGAMLSRTTNGAASGSVETTTNKIMLKTLDFDTAADEHVQFSIQMPKSWNEGTVTTSFVWSHAATTTNFGVAWFIQAVALSNDDAADVAFGTAIGVTDTGGTTNDIYTTATTAVITVGGTPAANDLVIFQIYRDVSDAGDTMAIDARLHGIQLYYTTDAATDV